MQTKHFLEDLLSPVIEAQGYELVRMINIGQKNPTVQIMIDRLDGKEITVDDCAKVSRAVSEVLDEKDPIDDRYNLEVSSPGLDRPLTKLAHFSKYAGYDAKIETSEEVAKRKRFNGKIVAVEGQNIRFAMADEEYVIPFDAVAKAKLVLTDELFAAWEQAQESVEL